MAEEPLLKLQVLLETGNDPGVRNWAREKAALFLEGFRPRESAHSSDLFRQYLRMLAAEWFAFAEVQLVRPSLSLAAAIQSEDLETAAVAIRRSGYLVNTAQRRMLAEIRTLEPIVYRQLVICHPAALLRFTDLFDGKEDRRTAGDPDLVRSAIWEEYYDAVADELCEMLRSEATFGADGPLTTDEKFGLLFGMITSPAKDFFEGSLLVEDSTNRLPVKKTVKELWQAEAIKHFDLQHFQYLPTMIGKQTVIPQFDDRALDVLTVSRVCELSESFFRGAAAELSDRIERKAPELAGKLDRNRQHDVFEFGEIQFDRVAVLAFEDIRKKTEQLKKSRIADPALHELLSAAWIANLPLLRTETARRLEEAVADCERLENLKAKLPLLATRQPSRKHEIFQEWIDAGTALDVAEAESATLRVRLAEIAEAYSSLDSDPRLGSAAAERIDRILVKLSKALYGGSAYTHSADTGLRQAVAFALEQSTASIKTVEAPKIPLRMEITNLDTGQRHTGSADTNGDLAAAGVTLPSRFAQNPMQRFLSYLPARKYVCDAAKVIEETFRAARDAVELHAGLDKSARGSSSSLSIEALAFDLAWEWCLGKMVNPYSERPDAPDALRLLYGNWLSRTLAREMLRADTIVSLLIVARKPELVFGAAELGDPISVETSGVASYLSQLARGIMRLRSERQNSELLGLFESVCCIVRSPYQGFLDAGEYCLNRTVDAQYGITPRRSRRFPGRLRRELLDLWVRSRNDLFYGTAGEPGWLYRELFFTFETEDIEIFKNIFQSILSDEMSREQEVFLSLKRKAPRKKGEVVGLRPRERQAAREAAHRISQLRNLSKFVEQFGPEAG